MKCSTDEIMRTARTRTLLWVETVISLRFDEAEKTASIVGLMRPLARVKTLRALYNVATYIRSFCRSTAVRDHRNYITCSLLIHEGASWPIVRRALRRIRDPIVFS